MYIDIHAIIPLEYWIKKADNIFVEGGGDIIDAFLNDKHQYFVVRIMNEHIEVQGWYTRP